jgi:glycosyltransferase involved in cell wall biosynthesis
MRILMLVQRPGLRSPVPKHTAHLVAGLQSLGCVVTTRYWGRSKEEESLATKLAQRARDVLSAHRAVRGAVYDVAVVKTAHDWHTVVRDIAIVLVLRRHCRPIVLQFHGSRASTLVGSGHRAFKLATRVLLSLVDAAFVLSHEEERQWQAFSSSVPVFVVKNPFVSNVSATARDGEVVGTPAHRALFVGRLIEEKGIFDAVDALPKVLAQMDCELAVVGEGRAEPQLRERITRLGLDDHVTVTGYLSGSDLTRTYLGCSLFVLPTTWIEGFPTVLAEAMDAGLAIVTTPIRGAVDHLVDGKNALFVRPHDIDGLAAAMVTLLRDSALRERMAAANREVLRRFEPEVVAEEYLQILRSLAGEDPTTAAGYTTA